MKKTTKKIIGLVGLATVAALTIAATGIDNSANATGEEASGDVTLQYTVIDEGKTNVTVEAPANKSETASSTIPVRVIYGATNTIKYSLSYTSPDGQTITIPLFEYTTPVYEGGIHEWSFNLADYDRGYGTYILNVDAFGSGTSSDSVEFTYQSIVFNADTDADGNIITDDNGSAEIDINADDNVDHAEIRILDSGGNPFINPATGQPVTIPITHDDIQKGKITIDFSQYGLTNNTKYILAVDTYTIDNQLIETVYYTLFYHVATADVPNTGGSFFAGLNLSNSDFLASSLLIFALVTIGAFVIIKKSSNNRRRR